jgi:hypothetical protein
LVDKISELKKYRDLVFATLDYNIENELLRNNKDSFASGHFKQLKLEAEEHFKKGRLTILKQWFHDLVENEIETRNFKFNQYLLEKTNYDVDIFKSFYEKIDKIINSGKIKTENQYRDLLMYVVELAHSTPIVQEKIELVNKFLLEYYQKKLKQVERARKKKEPSRIQTNNSGNLPYQE